MKAIPNNIDWFDQDEAATWPEGCCVLRVESENGQLNWRTLGFTLWHRPDWCDRNHKNYDKNARNTRYALLRLPNQKR